MNIILIITFAFLSINKEKFNIRQKTIKKTDYMGV